MNGVIQTAQEQDRAYWAAVERAEALRKELEVACDWSDLKKRLADFSEILGGAPKKVWVRK